MARHFLRRDVKTIFDTNQKPNPDLFSFDGGHLSTIRSLSIIADGLRPPFLIFSLAPCVIYAIHSRVTRGPTSKFLYPPDSREQEIVSGHCSVRIGCLLCGGSCVSSDIVPIGAFFWTS
ncbi:hypothetical protein ARMGADRAFT_738289 [Armillaria gallica]|uniref:Uncharacterized protein n=1 Tax=Armillaria gallica TaxID=47427 RepID=A0A2H3CK85_ARMGA|nr:hypothetical protein ARMGADRAFT_738289 [Armillaria gallica]